MNKFALILLLFFSVILFVFSQNREGTIYATSSGAIDGYDPVAYFIQGKALKGKDEFTFRWQGATWYFSSEENKSLFISNPEKYAPEYGGYCAYGIAESHKAKIDPKAWNIVNDKLYLNYNQDVKESWVINKDELIKKADINWERIKQE